MLLKPAETEYSSTTTVTANIPLVIASIFLSISLCLQRYLDAYVCRTSSTLCWSRCSLNSPPPSTGICVDQLMQSVTFSCYRRKIYFQESNYLRTSDLQYFPISNRFLSKQAPIWNRFWCEHSACSDINLRLVSEDGIAEVTPSVQ